MRIKLLPIHIFTGFLLAHAGGAWASAQEVSLADFGIGQPSDVVVSSVTRQETRLGSAPAAVYVIAGSDIHGGTVWGADVVDGVTNIVMRRAHETRGGRNLFDARHRDFRDPRARLVFAPSVLPSADVRC